MRKKKKTPIVEPTEEVITAEETTKKAKKKCKCGCYWLIACFLTILPIVLISVMNGFVLSGVEVVKNTALTALLSLFGLNDLAAASGRLGMLYTIWLYVMIVAIVATVVFTIISLCSKKAAKTFTTLIALINFLVYFGYAFLIFFTSYYRSYDATLKKGDITIDIPSLIVAAVSLLFFLILVIKKRKEKKAPKEKKVKEKKTKKKTREVAAEVPEESTVTAPKETSETVETVVATPVEGVKTTATESSGEETLEAENVGKKSDKDELPVVEVEIKTCAAPVPSGSKMIAFDWFLDSLLPEEKAEFQELFVFKYLGGTVILPEYVPGGDNREFFYAFFRNLGKYRNRISDELLEKMYQYVQKRY